MDVVQASIPLFFGLIALELVVAKVRGDRVYRLNDSIADLSLGTASQLIGIFLAIATIAVYGWVGDRWSIQGLLGAPAWIDRNPFPRLDRWLGFGIDGWALLSWATVFLLDDLAYYWVHRSSHQVNLLWAGHVVHHSSEEYNLAVALRQSSLHGLFSWVFYLPLALVGIPVTMWIVCHGLNLIYQFWIHTREINRLPRWLEAFLNTPSHHRVHHGINPQYQDKNYAGVFIIWDRLFGTFEPEVEEPVYGITKPLASWNPVWANLHYWADLGRRARSASRMSDKVRLFLKPPGWNPPDLGGFVEAPEIGPSPSKFAVAIPRRTQVYVLLQFAALLLMASLFLFNQESFTAWSRAAAASAIVASLLILGAMLDGRRWAVPAEVGRIAIGALAAVVLFL